MPETTQSLDSFGTRADLNAGGSTYGIYRLDVAAQKLGMNLARLPFTLRVLLENLLRGEDGSNVTADHIRAFAKWDPQAIPEDEIAFRPARVLLQDFTGVPCVVDLAAMRDAMVALGADPKKINPLQPVDLVIDHSVQVDQFGTNMAFTFNTDREFERNQERYKFLRWGQQAFTNFRVVPPGTGICHQVNLEYLAQVVFTGDGMAYPDSLVGTDSHTTMINGLGVVGWGVGGIEAEAAMLGQPVAMLLPQVIGVRLVGKLSEGATGTDLVLRVTELLRSRNVVGKFVEFFGAGLSTLPLATRATVANMCPEYGATVGFFPVDDETLNYLRFSGRDEDLIDRVEKYCKEQQLFRTDATPDPEFAEVLELDLGTIEPSLAGPKLPQARINLKDAQQSARATIAEEVAAGASPDPVHIGVNNVEYDLSNGSVVIAAITSCTNTSNPEVMIGAGLLAKKAIEKGLRSKPWVKTSLAPGSQVVTSYLDEAGLSPYLDQLGFELVGYGCTTCIGNSGPLPDAISNAVNDSKLAVAAVLSGNRNFEARVSQQVRSAYLASPPLVVAYALAGHMDFDIVNDPLGQDAAGNNIYLRDIWPSEQEVADTIQSSVRSEMYRARYADVFTGDDRWRDLPVSAGEQFDWEPDSTYVRKPPYFEDFTRQPKPTNNIMGARVLASFGNNVTTDHISPAGDVARNSPAARYLLDRNEDPRDFNSYGSRRGNHEVMVRGTFANVRLRNTLVEREGNWSKHYPDGEEASIFETAEKYMNEGVPTIILAGREYGTGSSRDWAAKGPYLQGVKAVIAQSFERIHRSNLIGMGVLPLQYKDGATAESLGLKGDEVFDITGIAGSVKAGQDVQVSAMTADGKPIEFTALCRIDTPVEADYYLNGGIMQYVIRQLLDQ
ncbi:MAG: aconitate hydratase AcnA [Chloroflexota bacterium]